MFIDLEGVTGNMVGSLKLDGPFYQMNGSSNFSSFERLVIHERFQSGSANGTMLGGRFTLNDLRLSRNQGQNWTQLAEV